MPETSGRRTCTASGAFTAVGVKGLDHPQAVAVDRSGDQYIADTKNNRVLRVAATTGATSTLLPFGDIHEPTAVAVDDAGDVFVGTGEKKVYKLPSGASGAVQLPFSDLHLINDIATDGPGNLYVGDGNRILELTAGSNSPNVVSLGQDIQIGGLAVDRRGDVFASDQQNDQVVELLVGSTQPTVLPFYGLSGPAGLSVDASGDLFVADTTTTGWWSCQAGGTATTSYRSPASTSLMPSRSGLPATSSWPTRATAGW